MTSKTTNYDYISKDFGEYKIFDEDNMTTERLGYEKLLSLLGDNNNLLDYWCGSGALTKQMSHYFKYTLWLDLSNNLVEMAMSENKMDNIDYNIGYK